MNLGAEQQFLVGEPPEGETELVIASFPPASKGLGAVFEDDGTTGYFYVVDQGGEDMEMLDALHIYDVADVTDKQEPVTAQIFWNEEENAVALILNGTCHALYDVKRQAGFCRNAFPEAKNGQTEPRVLTDELVEQYFAA
jgi:hypothetical protein